MPTRRALGPFCGLLFVSYGAQVLRIDRPGGAGGAATDILISGKSSVVLDLKKKSSRSVFLSLVAKADVLIDPFRPGVLENLGLHPDRVLRLVNPRLIAVRLTGFRRDGKYSKMAGHDINYLAVSGVLSLLGAADRPPLPPANILADFAGGGLAAFTGALLALLDRSVSGTGQVVHANMVDGAGFLGTFARLRTKTPSWSGPRGSNMLDGGCPYYGCYECKEPATYMSVGALEPQFFALLLKGLGLRLEEVVPEGLTREDPKIWPHMRKIFTHRFQTKTRKEWEDVFDGTDACCTPVLGYREMEAANYSHQPLVELLRSGARQVDAWDGKLLSPGQGDEEALGSWLGWQKDTDYVLHGTSREVRPVETPTSKI